MNESKMIHHIEQRIRMLSKKTDDWSKGELSAHKEMLQRYKILKVVIGPLWPWIAGVQTVDAVQSLRNTLEAGIKTHAK